jgi:hypothetical protein
MTAHVADPAYLRARYPSAKLRDSMAREADGVAARAVRLGNFSIAGEWRSMARNLRDSLEGVPA